MSFKDTLAGNFSFPSSGNAADDDEFARGFLKRQANIAEGLCPNGDGLLVAPADSGHPEWGGKRCTVCPFTGHGGDFER